MARIKGKWVGQVVVDFDMNDLNSDIYFKAYKERIDSGHFTEIVRDGIRKAIGWPAIGFLTVTQLHADLYRDEPSEWTKEEATP